MTDKRGKLARLEALELRQTARSCRPLQPDALSAQAQRVCCALPADLQLRVKADGARGYAALLEAWWEIDSGEDLTISARAAYRQVFGVDA